MSMLQSPRKSKNASAPRHRRARRVQCECRCASRLSIYLTIYIGWFVGFWSSIPDIIKAVKRVTNVMPFVTGFWEVFQTKEYCLGPTINPMPSYVGGEQIFVVVTEDVVLLKHSLWPVLKADLVSEGEEAESTTYEYNIYGAPCAPPEFIGQLRETEVRGVHRATYVLLALSRALCFVLVRAAAHMVPRPVPTRVVLGSRYDIFPVPTAEQVEQAQATLGERAYASNMYKPLRPDLIRGPEALEAARRAGFKFEI